MEPPRLPPIARLIPRKIGAWRPECASLLVERTRDYDLYFTEFDDQGWAYRPPESAINYAIAGIRDAITKQGNGVSIVTFVHGWKHSAAFDDEDVQIVRKVLTGLNHIESTPGGCGRRVIGVYAGWRGSSLEVDPTLQDITFWNRKDAADRVAQGSIRELFARIRATQIEGNQRAPSSANHCLEHPVRSLIVGHSFGGLIVYSVLSEALIRDVVDMQRAQRTGIAEPPGTTREGDLVLLINPAIEATKFDPLFRAAGNIDKWQRYHAPLFVSVTSIDDLATRMAFPLGRQISTTFDSYTPDVATAQRNANLQTLGQDQDYLTMELDTLEQYNRSVSPSRPLSPPPTCAGYGELSSRTDLSAGAILAGHVEMERETFAEFRRLLGESLDASRAYPRQFCADQTMVLYLPAGTDGGPTRTDPNSPVWNIRTRTPIVKDHGDVANPMLWQFVRQLYLDSEDNLLLLRPQ